MSQCAVVFYPKGDLEKIQILREKYNPQFYVIQPHITVISPFSNMPEEKIIEHLTEVARKMSAFPIHLNSFRKSFDDYLFLLVKEGKEEIQKIYGELYSGVLAYQLHNDIPFEPHITLGDFSHNNGLYEEALDEAKSLNLDIHCHFDSLTLIKGDGINPAKNIHEFNLGF
ncbi:MAG TPA: 2'-5' RNA ligase family protein [Candidatus Saccharimonadales bacterium]|nr:2'-5' RNA ligase family protein [Candidatus Saccharimonadales bacterium]